jgi:catechol 2,3-dioxygenase-like lactoylglutathione lyase family enzyme
MNDDAQTLNADVVRPGTQQPHVAGLHHLKIAVSDLAASLSWYSRALGAERLAEFDHVMPDGTLFAYIVNIPGVDTHVELRMAPIFAARQKGFDPIVFLVDTLIDLEEWATYLDGCGIENSGVLRGLLGWLLVCRDPDGLSVRFYTEERHEMDIQKADVHSPWVVYPD